MTITLPTCKQFQVKNSKTLKRENGFIHRIPIHCQCHRHYADAGRKIETSSRTRRYKTRKVCLVSRMKGLSGERLLETKTKSVDVDCRQ